jgi:hypothetical protein
MACALPKHIVESIYQFLRHQSVVMIDNGSNLFGSQCEAML